MRPDIYYLCCQSTIDYQYLTALDQYEMRADLLNVKVIYSYKFYLSIIKNLTVNCSQLQSSAVK
jgi:hypothetical protein